MDGLCFNLCAVLSLCSLVLSTQPCARFIFPSLSGSVFTAEENTNVSLPFIFDTSRCRHIPKDYMIVVLKTSISTQLEGDFCTILYRNGHCLLPYKQIGCKCPIEGKHFLEKKLDRSDSTEWVWRTNNGMAKEGRLSFNVTYKTKIIVSTLTTEPQRRVELSNVARTGRVDFDLIVVDGKRTGSEEEVNETGETENTAHGSSIEDIASQLTSDSEDIDRDTLMTVGANVAAFAVFVIIVVVVNILCARRARRKATVSPQTSEEDPLDSLNENGHHDSNSGSSENFYHEVEDAEMIGDQPQPLLPPLLLPVDSEDYLVPSPVFRDHAAELFAEERVVPTAAGTSDLSMQPATSSTARKAGRNQRCSNQDATYENCFV